MKTDRDVNKTMPHSTGLRILHIFHGLGTGGAETWLMALLRHWRSQKSSGGLSVQNDFLLTGGVPQTYDDEAIALGAGLHYCKSTRSNIFNYARYLRQVLGVNRYDAIHSHGDYQAGWHFLMGLNLLPPVRIAHVHNPFLHISANYAVTPARRLITALGRQFTLRFATHICGTSRAILREYGFDPDQTGTPSVSAVHCGIPVGTFNAPRERDRETVRQEFNWPADTRVVLFAGRLDRALGYHHPQNHKNSWFALNVLRQAAQQEPKLCLVMAGAGDVPRRQLEAAVADWGLSDRLRLVGVRHDIPRLMRASDVLFFPSRQEGLGMVAVEAQAAGLPVLASTAVPRECVVIPELCRFLSLDLPIDHWAQTLLDSVALPKPSLAQCRTAFRPSPFAIENSASALGDIYAGRRS